MSAFDVIYPDNTLVFPKVLSDQNVLYVDFYKKSLVILGDTKPWKENIKALGGSKFNNNLLINGQKKSGWLIFDKNREEEIRQFVDQVNTGQIAPMTPDMITTPVVASVRTRVAIGPKLQYQTITYKVIQPYVGQEVTLSISGKIERMLVVSSISNDKLNVVDAIILQDGEHKAIGVIISGNWEILDFGKDHTLTFH